MIQLFNFRQGLFGFGNINYAMLFNTEREGEKKHNNNNYMCLRNEIVHIEELRLTFFIGSL